MEEEQQKTNRDLLEQSRLRTPAKSRNGAEAALTPSAPEEELPAAAKAASCDLYELRDHAIEFLRRTHEYDCMLPRGDRSAPHLALCCRAQIKARRTFTPRLPR